MKPVVGIVAPGAMGGATARRLHDNGVEVLTSLDGRTPASVQRAKAAGMSAVSQSELARAGIFLSIVPPGAAISLAQQMAAVFTASATKPVYVDCNAINPETAQRVCNIVERAGVAYVDAGIIGG